MKRNALINTISLLHKVAISEWKEAVDYNVEALWKGRVSALNACLNKALVSETAEAERLRSLAVKIFSAPSHQLGEMVNEI